MASKRAMCITSSFPCQQESGDCAMPCNATCSVWHLGPTAAVDSQCCHSSSHHASMPATCIVISDLSWVSPCTHEQRYCYSSKAIILVLLLWHNSQANLYTGAISAGLPQPENRSAVRLMAALQNHCRLKSHSYMEAEYTSLQSFL